MAGFWNPTCVLRLASAIRVLAVHDLRLRGVQLQSQEPEPLGERGLQLPGLLLGVARSRHLGLWNGQGQQSPRWRHSTTDRAIFRISDVMPAATRGLPIGNRRSCRQANAN
jgi:hypothetical protein